MQLRISRAADLATRALLAVAEHDDPLSGAVLAERIGTTTGLLPQIVRPLLRAGFLESIRGPGGGYRSATPLERVHLLEVIEAVEGPTDTGECVLADRGCSAAQPCALHDAWSTARTSLMEQLRATPLASLRLPIGDTPSEPRSPRLHATRE